MKGLLFAGDSFTWGQGLYFYSELPNIKMPPKNGFNRNDVTKAHIKYKDSKRFARIVANHYDTFELVNKDNGGSDIEIIDFIENVFLSDGYSYEDFDFLFFQTTHFIRSIFDFELNGQPQKTFITDHQSLSQSNYQNFEKWLETKNYNIDEYVKIHLEQVFNKIKNKFKEIESKGIVCKIMSWDDDYIDLILNDDYMRDKFFKITYNNVEYVNIKELTTKNNHLLICNDVENLGNNPPRDGHLSLMGHRVVAESIIKEIEKNKKKI